MSGILDNRLTDRPTVRKVTIRCVIKKHTKANNISYYNNADTKKCPLPSKCLPRIDYRPRRSGSNSEATGATLGPVLPE